MELIHTGFAPDVCHYIVKILEQFDSRASGAGVVSAVAGSAYHIGIAAQNPNIS
jgi:hypothetical protein